MGEPKDDVVDSLAYSIIDCSLVLLVVALSLFSTTFVMRFHHRLKALRFVRIVLCFLLLCWVSGSLVSDVSFWEVVVAVFGWQPSVKERETICQVYVVVSFGFIEAAMLVLIGGMFYRKSRGGAVTMWQPWQLVRRAFEIAFASAVLQAAMLLLVESGAVPSNILGPMPPTPMNYTGWDVGHLLPDDDFAPSPPPPELPPPLPSLPVNTTDDDDPQLVGDFGSGEPPPQQPPRPPMPPAAPPIASPPPIHSWWRREGCASSYGTLAVSCIVFVGFEVVWYMSCRRLLRTAKNVRMRRRLRVVQATYTVAPVLLLLLRALLIWLPADWYINRRLVKSAEIVVMLLTSVVGVHSLVLRPIREGRRLDGEARPAPPESASGRRSLDGLHVSTIASSCSSSRSDGESSSPVRVHGGGEGGGAMPLRRRLLQLFRPAPQSMQWPTTTVVVDLDASPQPRASAATASHELSSSIPAAPPPPAGTQPRMPDGASVEDAGVSAASLRLSLMSGGTAASLDVPEAEMMAPGLTAAHLATCSPHEPLEPLARDALATHSMLAPAPPPAPPSPAPIRGSGDAGHAHEASQTTGLPSAGESDVLCTGPRRTSFSSTSSLHSQHI